MNTINMLRVIEFMLDDPDGVSERTYRALLDALAADHPNIVYAIEMNIESAVDANDELRFFFPEDEAPNLTEIFMRKPSNG